MKIFFLFASLLMMGSIEAQDVFSDISLMDYQRIAQLLDSNHLPERSFAIRSSSQLWNQQWKQLNEGKKAVTFQILDIGYTIQTNTNLPYGVNDGSLYSSVGMQQRMTIGALIQWKGFSLHLQPEFVSVANKNPIGFETSAADTNYWPKYYLYNVNKIDNFGRFGTSSFDKIFAGQSSLTYSKNGFSLGISTENLWWGPGLRNSLVLTNNAPGFLHFSFNTLKPIHTNWGNLEFQTIYGFLENANTEAPDNALMRTIKPQFIASKPSIQRNIFGWVFNWNPKWTPNLHIGMAAANYHYSSAVPVTPTPLVLTSENRSGSASLGSVFFRYAMPKEQAEVYLEYGRSDRFANPFNIIGDTIPTGYMAGFRKLFKQAGKKAGILFGIEVTQLQLPDARLIFHSQNLNDLPKTNSWYTHPFITQGFTNQAQVMGAAIGPGSNSELVHISWVKGLKKIGISAERIAHNNDFYYYNYFSGTIGLGAQNRYWADWNLGVNLQWDYQQWLFTGSYVHSSALNYRWVKVDGTFDGPSSSDKLNDYLNLSISYFFAAKSFTTK